MSETYPQFFQRVTGKRVLPYQEQYGQEPFSPVLLIIPTGLGKTDAAIMPFLYRHAFGDSATPRRLIVVLPRQNLTSQTTKIARKRVADAGLDIPVIELMAGSQDNDENLEPDQTAIIVATQDMYFSRALNRGYARRPSRWPIDFALYNQDCVVVLDEIQLMDDALATSTQLAAFRAEFGTYGAASCVWMSATVNPEWLRTVNFEGSIRQKRLTEADLCDPLVNKRLHAAKSVSKAPETCNTPAGCAQFAIEQHKPDSRTLVVVNTVARAREVYAAVKYSFPSAVLLHSRFRPGDRAAAAAKLDASIPAEGQIIVATQVLEAGVDITAQRMICDIAPWGSMVQRFGRVNRYGDDDSADIWWVDAPTHKKQKDPTAPYNEQEIARAKERLAALASASPARLAEIPEDGPEPWQHVLRRADLLDLFDTTPDLSGNQIDVSRFIRATEDKDVYLAWRNWDGSDAPPEDLDDLTDGELCPVPMGEFREFLQKHEVYTWNFTREEWEPVEKDRVYAGMVAVTPVASGGYTTDEGWSPESKAKAPPVTAGAGTPAEGDSSDKPSFQTYRQGLRAHTDRVAQELERLLSGLEIDDASAAALLTAAAKHDWGKAHQVFQTTMHSGPEWTELLAKREGKGRHGRRHFRHELASALAMLQTGDSDLAAYLAAAHHGRVRLGIRSMPGEGEVENLRTARGIQDGDQLPACELASGLFVPPVTLSLEAMELGATGGSWTERMLRLLDELGPFRLAYLEALLRAADTKASEDPQLEATACTN